MRSHFDWLAIRTSGEQPSQKTSKQESIAKGMKGSLFALGKVPEHHTYKQQAQLAFIAKSGKLHLSAYMAYGFISIGNLIDMIML